MKVLFALTLIAAICVVYGEVCHKTAANCTATTCGIQHSHLECVEDHCTCAMDPSPCLTGTDCDTKKCFERHGHQVNFHCLDGYCKCVEV